MADPATDLPVRLALIGAGLIGRKHLRTIAAQPGADLVALVDPAPAAVDLAAEQGVPCFADTGEMLAALAPDGVVVATPTPLHLDPVLAALEAGAHVLVEKPIAATDDEAARIIAAADRTGRQVLVGHHRRHYPVLTQARELLASGAIGDLVTVHGHWTVLKAGGDYWVADWRRYRAAGPVLVNLIHEFDTLRHVCGEITSVQAEMTNHVRGWEKEDAAVILVTFAGGAIGTFTLSDATPSPWAWEFATGENPDYPPSHRNTHRFTGTLGALEFPNLALWRQDRGAGWQFPIRRQPVAVQRADAYARQCAHFCAVIRGRADPLISARDGARTLRAVTAVFEAAETGRRVALTRA